MVPMPAISDIDHEFEDGDPASAAHGDALPHQQVR
jgi:hypothetical protein